MNDDQLATPTYEETLQEMTKMTLQEQIELALDLLDRSSPKVPDEYLGTLVAAFENYGTIDSPVAVATVLMLRVAEQKWTAA